MKRLPWILAALACLGQACSDDATSGDDDDDDTGTSSGSHVDASTGRATSSSSGAASSSSGAAASSSSGATSSSSGGTADAGDRCQAAAARAEARYTECDVAFAILDGGTPAPCTDEKAAADEHLAQCVEAADCQTLRGEGDGGQADQDYFECLGE